MLQKIQTIARRNMPNSRLTAIVAGTLALLLLSGQDALSDPVSRVVNDQGFEVQLDLTSQVLSLNVSPLEETLLRPVSPSPVSSNPSSFVSAAILSAKAKQFDDGLYAAVELAAQSGCGKLSGKGVLLKEIADYLGAQHLSEKSNVQQVMLGAAKLGDLHINVPDDLSASIDVQISDFMKDEVSSKPIGSYTWSDSLKRIYRQDRMLQSELKGSDGIASLVGFFRKDELAQRAYVDQLALASSLTNPFRKEDLRSYLIGAGRQANEFPNQNRYFLPPSASHEDELLQKLYGNKPIPDGFVLIDEMVNRIRSGKIKLAPRKDSGWYDYQVWSLEPLVVPTKMPEAQHLRFSDNYEKQLVELFKGLIALSRETHIKQLGKSGGGGAGGSDQTIRIFIFPALSCEPLATYYFRRAVSYKFVKDLLEHQIGVDGLRQLHRLKQAGESAKSLDDELNEMENLFAGAYVSISRQLGTPDSRLLKLDDNPIPETSVAMFQKWAASPIDPDVSRDERMMVPIFYDLQRRKTKAWVFLGWVSDDMSVDFEKTPSVISCARDSKSNNASAKMSDPGNKAPLSYSVIANDRLIKSVGGDRKHSPTTTFEPNYLEVIFDSNSYQVAFPVTAEVYVDKVLNREEFRALCDRCQTPDRILGELAGYEAK